MLTRILTAVVALVLFVGILVLPSWVFIVAMIAIIGFMAYEGIECTKPCKSIKLAGYISTLLLLVGYYYKVLDVSITPMLWAVILSIMLHCVVVIYEHGRLKYTEVFASCLFVIYIVLSMSCVVFCRNDFGTEFMLLIFICSWMTDTGAYFVGSFMGKHKLIPDVSPKKTVEGAIGGVVVCMLSCFVYSMILNYIDREPLVNMQTATFVVVGMTASVLSQLGDLVASSIKRDTGIKDFGSIFPGHGGFLDRFDSVMFVAPVVYGFFSIIWG